jgi:molecular chaperone HscB
MQNLSIMYSSLARGLCVRAAKSQAVSHFAVLGLAPRFSVDAPALSEALRSLQRECHPDRHANDSNSARERAAVTSACANIAYAVLKSPESRAMHLLDLLATGDDRPDLSADPDLLDWVMRMREMLDDDDVSDDKRVGMRSEVKSLIEACLVDMVEAFDGDSAVQEASGDTLILTPGNEMSPERVQRAASLTVRFKYLMRILNAIDERLPVVS